MISIIVLIFGVYFITVPNLLSIRDLRSKHAPMLRQMFRNATQALHLGTSDGTVVGYVDYFPTFTPFHLHVERVPVSTEAEPGCRFLLDDILENLEQERGQEYFETECLCLGTVR